MKNIDILDRCVGFSLSAITIYREIAKTGEGKVAGGQFVRSSTSIGANVNEAQAAQSRADFVHKLQIALKEARETVYWLKIIEGSGMLPKEKLSAVKDETAQISRILASIIVKTKANSKNN